MSFFVYILYSHNHNRTYTGQTDNVESRITKHNSGRVKSTKAYKPWVLIHTDKFNSRAEAMKQEKWYKSSAGRKRIAEILKNYLHSI